MAWQRVTPETPCAAGTLRRASRSLARLYDAHLTRAGFTTTQFSILRWLQRLGGSVALSELATDLAFERTSLYRALAPLRRAGLVSVRSSRDRRAKTVALTPRAARRVAQAMPHWLAAQRTVFGRVDLMAWHDLAARVGELTATAQAALQK